MKKVITFKIPHAEIKVRKRTPPHLVVQRPFKEKKAYDRKQNTSAIRASRLADFFGFRIVA
ncbi:MAG TPA: hypothetical protein VKC60_08845 [Opitutaceae bacterium]|nr:hypothetical protein [Opitutaceae bacterium]